MKAPVCLSFSLDVMLRVPVFFRFTTIAYLYILLGQKDIAFDWLDKAFEERDGMIINIIAHPYLIDPIRSHPRHKALLRKINLEP